MGRKKIQLEETPWFTPGSRVADDMTPEQRQRFLAWAKSENEATVDEWLTDMERRIDAYAQAAKDGALEDQAVAELMRIVHALHVQLHALRRRVEDLELWKAQHGG